MRILEFFISSTASNFLSNEADPRGKDHRVRSNSVWEWVGYISDGLTNHLFADPEQEQLPIGAKAFFQNTFYQPSLVFSNVNLRNCGIPKSMWRENCHSDGNVNPLGFYFKGDLRMGAG